MRRPPQRSKLDFCLPSPSDPSVQAVRVLWPSRPTMLQRQHPTSLENRRNAPCGTAQGSPRGPQDALGSVATQRLSFDPCCSYRISVLVFARFLSSTPHLAVGKLALKYWAGSDLRPASLTLTPRVSDALACPCADPSHGCGSKRAIALPCQVRRSRPRCLAVAAAATWAGGHFEQ